MNLSKPKYEIVLRYLSQGEGERTTKLYPDHGLEFGMFNNQLNHILYTDNEEMWCASDISLNEFIRLCELKTEEEMIAMLGSIALTKINRKERQ